MPKSLVVITGASSGIGAVFARKLAAGHDLLLIARRKDRLDELAAELSRDYDSQVEVLVADLSDSDDLTRAANRIQASSNLALLINNAGFGTKGRFWEASLDSQEQMHRLHVMATVRLTHVALANMVPRDFGGVINVASVAAYVRSIGSVSYSATKGWMKDFTEGLYLELRSIRSNVTVQALCPGFTYSEFHQAMGVTRQARAPSSFWMTAEQVVDDSLAGLRSRKLFVIPGWRYRVLTSLLGALPAQFRLAFESAAGRNREPLNPKRFDSGIGRPKIESGSQKPE